MCATSAIIEFRKPEGFRSIHSRTSTVSFILMEEIHNIQYWWPLPIFIDWRILVENAVRLDRIVEGAMSQFKRIELGKVHFLYLKIPVFFAK